MSNFRITPRRLVCSLFLAIMITLAVAPVFKTAVSTSGAVYAASASYKGKTGFIKKNGKWYYLKEGRLQCGWIKVGNLTYFAKRVGKQKYVLVQGWLQKQGKWYYFREKGKKGVICSMVAGKTYKVNGISCVFNKNGTFRKFKYAGRKKTFVQKVGEMARENQARHNILASLVTAQACLETGYGRHIHYNNLFGIRSGYGYRHYSSWSKSLEHYTSFMKSYLPYVFGVRSSSRACSIVGSSGYAQAGNYGSVLMSVISSNNLTRFNR